MNTVLIPSGYFLKQSKQEYSDYRTRLGAELFQNSVDAGATEIYLDFSNEGYSISDNGRGMSEETMVKGMLTLGGTVKTDGSTGGFGHAKILLLFSMDSFSIESNGKKTEGVALQYAPITNVPFKQGTTIKGKFPAEWGGDRDYMVNAAKNFLKKCQLKARVYINGEQFTDWKYVKRCTRSNEWSRLYTHKLDYDNCYITVRKNGLFMFQKYMGQPVKKEIILEVTAPSLEVLTANRDGFKSQYDKEFSALFAEICADKKSFDRNKPKKFRFKGRENFISASFQEQLKRLDGEIKIFMEQVAALAQDKKLESLEKIQTFNFGDDSAMAARMVEEAKTFVKEHLKTDFIVDLGDSGLTEIPKRLHPNTMAVTNQTIAKLWRAALDTVFEANKMQAQYRIGFTLDSNTVAHYNKTEGIEEFLINPEAKFWENDKWERTNELCVTACHEITHREHAWHDESFILRQEELLVKTLSMIKGDMNYITKKAKNVEL